MKVFDDEHVCTYLWVYGNGSHSMHVLHRSSLRCAPSSLLPPAVLSRGENPRTWEERYLRTSEYLKEFYFPFIRPHPLSPFGPAIPHDSYFYCKIVRCRLSIKCCLYRETNCLVRKTKICAKEREKEWVKVREKEIEREKSYTSHPVCCGLAGGMRGEWRRLIVLSWMYY